VLLAPVVGVSLSVVLVLKLILLAFIMSFAVTSLGVLIAARMTSMQGFQMIMNFLVMPLYFLSGAMFPMSSAPSWMKALMTFDPLVYGVDAIRNVVFSETVIRTGAGVTQSLAEVAHTVGLVRWSLGYDLALITLAAIALTAAGAWSFSTSQAG
jgi:ABC-2 type transport system permease protein